MVTISDLRRYLLITANIIKEKYLSTLYKIIFFKDRKCLGKGFNNCRLFSIFIFKDQQ